MLFDDWTRDEVVTAIRSLEQQVVSGAQQLSMQGGGSVTMQTRAEAMRAIIALKRRRDQLDGIRNPSRARVIRVIVERGY